MNTKMPNLQMTRVSNYAAPLLMILILLMAPAKILAQENGITCFVYHRFGNDRYPSTNIPTDVFEEQLKYLKNNNYQVITFGEAVDWLEKDTTIPDKVAVITIDDGYSTVYVNGWPLLKKYGFPATVFISTQQVGYHNQLSWAQIREMQQAGIEIGIHSHSHRYFLDVPAGQRLDTFEADLKTSKTAFKKHLGTVPDVYAYPFGEYTLGMKSILQKHGIKAAAAQHSGVMSKRSNQYALPRFPMNGMYGSLESFKSKIRMRPFPVLSEQPQSPMTIGGQVPTLTLSIDTALVDPSSINCYWYGTANCQVKMANGSSTRITVTTGEKVRGRRGKFTLTAPLKTSGRWAWYSHPWFQIEQ